jgi:hypothetical protein
VLERERLPRREMATHEMEGDETIKQARSFEGHDEAKWNRLT